MILFVPPSLLFAVLSWHLVEKPAPAVARRATDQQRVVAGLKKRNLGTGCFSTFKKLLVAVVMLITTINSWRRVVWKLDEQDC